MRALIISLALLPFLWSNDGQAASMAVDNSDCAKILERWANDPKSVPKRLVDQCKEQMAAAEAPPRVFPAPAAGAQAATDPCVGPNAANSVLCWGPWSALAPAAAGPPVAANPPGAVEGYDPRPELADPFQPIVVPEPPFPPLPLDSCPPGAPCGFATVMDGVIFDQDDESQNAIFKRIDLASDGSQYTIDPGGEGEIASVTGMNTLFLPRTPPDGYETLFANGRNGDEGSALAARVARGTDEAIETAADFWAYANRAAGTGNNGHFAWGITTNQAGLDRLNGQGVTVAFTGLMSVDNRTTGSMTLNFGTQANWTGNWVNPGYNFSAAGPMKGADLISDAAKFSANVQAGSVVQGALVGEPGTQSVIHIIDVNLADKGRVRDVGLLRQVAEPASSAAATN